MEENSRPKPAVRVKDKRPPCSQEGGPKKCNKLPEVSKNELQYTSPSSAFSGNLPFKKLFTQVNKIVKIGLEKEYALMEKDTTLQNSNETIDNLRKNMLHLQMEYEKLDQNFQREVSGRSEIVKRMEATRELVESVVQCSNVLEASVKQLENDKLKIAEFYEMIYEKQKEVEAKHAEFEKLIKQQEELSKAKMQELKQFQCKILSQNSETISQLNKKLICANDRLKTAGDENENLQKKIQQMEETSARFQSLSEHREKLNDLHQENITILKRKLKILKSHRFKYQKLLKNNKNRLSAVADKNKQLKKSLEKKELNYNEIVLAKNHLESNCNEWRNNFDKHLEEDATERQNWETEREKLINELEAKDVELGDLKEERENLNVKTVELIASEEAKRLELEQIQIDLSELLKENLKLKEDVIKLTEESNDKGKIISELELKSNSVDSDLHSQLKFYKNQSEKFEHAVKKLEIHSSDLQKRLAYEKSQNKKIISDYEKKLEENFNETNKKTADLEKLLQDKATVIENLKSREAQMSMNNRSTLDKLQDELQSEKSKNAELNRDLKNTKTNYQDVSLQLDAAKKQISDLEGKLTDVNSANKMLTRAQTDSERNSLDLKNKVEWERKRFGDLEEKYQKAEKELSKAQKTGEENVALKLSNTELKSLLETTEARLEAYKVAVRKLENEKIETRNSHSQELSKLKQELTRLEETIKKDKFRSAPPQSSETRREPETPISRRREKATDFSCKLNAKENEPEMADFEKLNQTSPLQSGKKLLLTPRKVFTSTPQSESRKATRLPKKRDPYEFDDSDSSVERFGKDKGLSDFRKKECTNKKPKTK